jgi:hypothetical protein
MLNRQKTKNNFFKPGGINNVVNLILKDKFLQIPELSKNQYIQTSSDKEVDFGFPLIFLENELQPTKTNADLNRFSYDSKQFQKFHKYHPFLRKAPNKRIFSTKSLFVFLDALSKKRKKVPYYILKQMKGGYMIGAFGAIYFVPRSLYKNVRQQQIINLKLFQKNTKKFTRPLIKINLVSSLKHGKPKG